MRASCSLRFPTPLRGDALDGVARFLVLHRERTGARVYRRRVTPAGSADGRPAASRWITVLAPDSPRLIRQPWPDDGVELSLPVVPPLDGLSVDSAGIRMRAAESVGGADALPTFSALVGMAEVAIGREARVVYAARRAEAGDLTFVLDRMLGALRAAGGAEKLAATYDGARPAAPPPAHVLLDGRRHLRRIAAAEAFLPRTVAFRIGDGPAPRRLAAAVAGEASESARLVRLGGDTPAGRLTLHAPSRDAAGDAGGPAGWTLEITAGDPEGYRRLLDAWIVDGGGARI